MGHKRTRVKKHIEPALEDILEEEVGKRSFSLDFLNQYQRSIWHKFEKNDIIFLSGSAGTGKSFLAASYAIYSLLEKKTQKIVVTRPIVEAGEKLGFLPGTFQDKVYPYMLPLYDALDDLCGPEGINRSIVDKSIEVATVANLRGRTLKNSVCILDEAQNCTYVQLKLFLTRIGYGSKMIITGDPKQTDLGGRIAMLEIIDKIKNVGNVGVINIGDEHIVRHPIIHEITSRI
jgi:phosphate starvation-inducible PhoH-like protein